MLALDQQKGLSKAVIPNQLCDPDSIRELVFKHQTHRYQKAIREHNKITFSQLSAWLQSRPNRPLILDSGCGTAMSSFKLASMHQNANVIGLDQSLSRLNKATNQNGEVIELPENLRLYQGNCEDIWRQCLNENIRCSQHYILYPNPWPKARHLKRRWHGHPVFPVLPQIADQTTLRSNWKAYLEEFNLGWKCLTGKSGEIKKIAVGQPFTRFEKKYHESNQPLFELVLDN